MDHYALSIETWNISEAAGSIFFFPFPINKVFDLHLRKG